MYNSMIFMASYMKKYIFQEEIKVSCGEIYWIILDCAAFLDKTSFLERTLYV